MKEINPKPNKKREHEALLFKLEVGLNTDGNILFNYDWVKPELVVESLKDYEHAHIISAIIRHCLSNGYKLDNELNYLLNKDLSLSLNYQYPLSKFHRIEWGSNFNYLEKRMQQIFFRIILIMDCFFDSCNFI